MASLKGYLMILSALVFCPCHLPIYGALLAGTALGATLTDNSGLLFPVMALYFVGAVFLAVRWMTRPEAPAGGVAARLAAAEPKAVGGRADCCAPSTESDMELVSGGSRREVRDGNSHR